MAGWGQTPEMVNDSALAAPSRLAFHATPHDLTNRQGHSQVWHLRHRFHSGGLADSESGIKARSRESKDDVNDNGKIPKIILWSLQSDWNVCIRFRETHSYTVMGDRGRKESQEPAKHTQDALCRPHSVAPPAFAQVVNPVDGPVNVVRSIPKENQSCGTRE